MIQIEGFNLRIVAKGDAYGLNDCLTHNHEDVLVEFYDAKQDPAKFGRRGQFVSRYYYTTLLDAGSYPSGLQLDGGVPAWAISKVGMRDVVRYINGYLLEQS